MTILKTKDFILRPLKIEDAEVYFEITQDKLAQRGFIHPPKDLKEAKEDIKKYIDQGKKGIGEPFAIEVNGEYAGSVILQFQNFNPKDYRGRMHIWLHPKFRGQGIMTRACNLVVKYAFKKYKWVKIIAQTRSYNKSAQGVLKRTGFKLEGILKKDTIKDGKYVDNTLWARMNPKSGRNVKQKINRLLK